MWKKIEENNKIAKIKEKAVSFSDMNNDNYYGVLICKSYNKNYMKGHHE